MGQPEPASQRSVTLLFGASATDLESGSLLLDVAYPIIEAVVPVDASIASFIYGAEVITKEAMASLQVASRQILKFDHAIAAGLPRVDGAGQAEIGVRFVQQPRFVDQLGNALPEQHRFVLSDKQRRATYQLAGRFESLIGQPGQGLPWLDEHVFEILRENVRQNLAVDYRASVYRMVDCFREVQKARFLGTPAAEVSEQRDRHEGRHEAVEIVTAISDVLPRNLRIVFGKLKAGGVDEVAAAGYVVELDAYPKTAEIKQGFPVLGKATHDPQFSSIYDSLIGAKVDGDAKPFGSLKDLTQLSETERSDVAILLADSRGLPDSPPFG